MPIPKILHFTTGPKPTRAQSEIMEIARRLHPDWELMHWTDEPIGPLTEWLDKCESGAQRADLIRIDAVLKHGGVYLDSDVRLHRALDPLVEAYDCFACSEDGGLLTNAVFGAAPGHPAIQDIASFLMENEPNWSLPPNQTTGPHMWTRILRHDEQITVLPRETFYPYLYGRPKTDVHRTTYGEHEWAGSWLPKKDADKATRRLHEDIVRVHGKKRKLKNYLARQLDKTGRVYNIVRSSADTASVYDRGNALMVRTMHGHMLSLPKDDLSVTPSLATTGSYERAEELYMKRALAGGDWFVDVGANIGVFTALASNAVGPFGRVFAFEPNPTCHEHIQRTAYTNWTHERLRLIKKAASDTAAVFELDFHPESLGGAALSQIESSAARDLTSDTLGSPNKVSVEAVRLDDAFPVDLPIKMLKVDVEGHEASVLRGAERLISNRLIDHIMVEALYDTPQNWRALVDELHKIEKAGYVPGLVDRRGRFLAAESVDHILAEQLSRNIIFQFGGQ